MVLEACGVTALEVAEAVAALAADARRLVGQDAPTGRSG